MNRAPTCPKGPNSLLNTLSDADSATFKSLDELTFGDDRHRAIRLHRTNEGCTLFRNDLANLRECLSR